MRPVKTVRARLHSLGSKPGMGEARMLQRSLDRGNYKRCGAVIFSEPGTERESETVTRTR